MVAWCLGLSAQSFQARMNEDYSISVEEIDLPEQVEFRDEFEQLPGFPKGTPTSPNFKNSRNVTLHDIDGDGVADILFATNNKLFAYNASGLIWEKTLSGTVIYPPSVADINQDGLPEIVQVTGGIPNAGRIYVMDNLGQNLSGWPVNLDNNWILTAPTLSDLDGDNIMEIVAIERDPPAGNVHIFKLDGTSFSEDWPVALDNTPAVTPSIGDVDNDGEKDIVVYSTNSRYIFGLDGQAKSGFPLTTAPAQRYSFQSPILVDFDEDQGLEIVGSTHGDTQTPDPQFYVMNADGTDRTGWPIDVPNDNWTYSTPTVVEIDGAWNIFMSRPLGDFANDMLWGWDEDGNLLPGFPINKVGGLEGIISVADVDNDDEFELIFGRNQSQDGFGFIHAYELDGSGEVEGFPIRPKGWTYLNGAALGDVDNDGMMDLTALSYTLNLGQDVDSAFVNVYNLEVPFSPEKVLWSTYKGSNTRTGLMGEEIVSSVFWPVHESIELTVIPNPAKDYVRIRAFIEDSGVYDLTLMDIQGRVLKRVLNGLLQPGLQEWRWPLNNLDSGVYWISINKDGQVLGASKLMIIK